jgi:hypothetical protein
VVKGGGSKGCGELSSAGLGVDITYDIQVVSGTLLACLNHWREETVAYMYVGNWYLCYELTVAFMLSAKLMLEAYKS